MTEATLYATRDNPVPDRHTAGYFTGQGGKRLRYAVFRCEQSLARGTIVLLQGRNECIEKYFETIADFTAMGFWVAAYDMRGQGGSERLLDAKAFPGKVEPGFPFGNAEKQNAGHVRRFADYTADISLFLEQIVLPDARLPFFLVAHSTGALAALALAPALSGRIERMALVAPFVGLGGQGLPVWLIRLASAGLSLAGLGRLQLSGGRRDYPFEANPFTSDPGRFARNRAIRAEHPELFVGPPTARWLHEALSTIGKIRRQEHLTTVTVPTLLFAPVLDSVIPFQAQEQLASNFRAAQLIPVTGARHELLQERDVLRNQTLAAIDAFFVPAG